MAEPKNTQTMSKKSGKDPKVPRNFFLLFPKFELKFPPIFNILQPKPEEQEKENTTKKPPDVVKTSQIQNH